MSHNPWNKGKKLVPDPLTPEEAMRLGTLHEQATDPRDIRSNAILVILWRCGLRSNELCRLDLQDFRRGKKGTGSIRVRTPKGLKKGASPRELGLDARSCGSIRKWLKIRGNADGPLFPTASGLHMDTSQLRRSIPRLGKLAGIKRRVHVHGLRHTFALELYREEIGIVSIQHALGHTSLDMTARYLRGIGASEVVEITAGRVW